MSSQIVGRPMEILLVEDSLMDARVTIEALRGGNLQHRLTLVRDGDEAIQFLRQEGRFVRAPRPDLILLDLMLPKRSGLDVLAETSNDFELKQIPVVVLTASDNEEDKAQCNFYDVNTYIHKPVNLTKFLTVIKELKRCWREDVIVPMVD